MGSMIGNTTCEICGCKNTIQELSNSLDVEKISCPECKKSYIYEKEWIYKGEEPYDATSG
jgi:hypothetical protein